MPLRREMSGQLNLGIKIAEIQTCMIKMIAKNLEIGTRKGPITMGIIINCILIAGLHVFLDRFNPILIAARVG